VEVINIQKQELTLLKTRLTMAIIRIEHNRENPYVTLNKAPFHDENMSLKAKGLWGMCLTYPTNWEFRVSHLKKTLKEGEKAIYSAIDELSRNGYVLRFQMKEMSNNKLVFTGIKYIVFEFKLSEEERNRYVKEFLLQFPYSHYVNYQKGEGVKNEKPLKDTVEDHEDDGGIQNRRAENRHAENRRPQNRRALISNKESEYIINPPPPTPPPPEIQDPNPIEETKKQTEEEEEDLKINLLEDKNLSSADKMRLMRFSYQELERSLAIAEDIPPKKGLINLLMHILKNPNDYQTPDKKIPNHTKFNKGSFYNNFECLKDEIGVGFFKQGMMQPYSVKWNDVNFNEKWKKLLIKIGIING
jgi:hypothetical protein